MKYLFTNSEITPKRLKSLPFKLEVKQIGNFYFYTDSPGEILENESFVGITEGYLRDLDLENKSAQEHTLKAYKNIAKQWPLPENITGSFSTVLFDKNSSRIIICNDLIGPYPLYFLKKEASFFISNSIILMAMVSQAEFDEAGIAQRCLGPEFTNIGSRTILENCKRLLPGEFIKIDKNGVFLEKKYDNSLYQNMSSPNQNHELYKAYWKNFKKEVSYCLNERTKVNIALSGGIDSRILLGAISDDREINCVTYGDKDNYETKIAGRLAKAKNANFNNFSEPELNFPKPKILKKYTLKTEAVELCSWLEILENKNPENKEPVLMGDLATVLTGRTIKKFSSKKFRQNNFFKYSILKDNYTFEKANPENFENWKKTILESYNRWYSENNISLFNLNISTTDLTNALHSDINEIFSRIKQHDLPLVELYDELFIWFTHTRIKMAKQILIGNAHNNCYCPPMSTKTLRFSSRIHPNLRLDFRFVNKLFNHTEDLREIHKIPTSQIPMIPQNFPNFIRFPVWGLRSKIDHYFIKRMMKHKDPGKRYRLFKSNNWALVYQNPCMEKHLRGYFKNNYLGDGIFKKILHQSLQRKALNSWPFANMEIMNAAALNIEIDIIDTIRRKHSDNI